VVLTIWMAGWQLQCCGEPFSVGETVEWTLAPVSDRDPLILAMGHDLAETVTHNEDHHGLLLPEGSPRTAGHVRSIRAIHGPHDEATPVRSANGWEQEGARTVGYLVELDLL
jgi:hypothetical protein